MRKVILFMSVAVMIAALAGCKSSNAEQRKAMNEPMKQEREFMDQAIRHRSPDVMRVDVIDSTVVFTHIYDGIVDVKAYTFDGDVCVGAERVYTFPNQMSALRHYRNAVEKAELYDNIELFNWDGTLNLQPVIQPLGIVIISAAAAVFGSVWLVKKLYATRSFDHIALRQEMKADEGFTGVVTGLESLVGESVTVFTDMRPSGKVKTEDGRIIEATLKFGGYALKGEVLTVLSAEQGRLYCDRLK